MPKNIIFYFSDQQRYDTVNELLTPNLSYLASEGVTFENSYTCQPVCGPARACLQTGVYASENGSHWNGIALSNSIRPLAEYFKEAGYDTAYIGKWHLASDRYPGEGLHCETSAVPPDRRGGYEYWRAADVLEFTSHGYDGYIFDENENRIDFKGYRVDCINDFAIEYIDKHTGQKPFFMFVSQLEPHHQNDTWQFEGPIETRDNYKDYPLPDDLTFMEGNYEESYPDYVAAINRIDENVGRLCDKLREKGIYDDTIIIYTSDHGCHFCTRNSEYKRSCHDSTIHTPLIISGGEYKGGVHIDKLVSLIDLPPTLLSMAGIDIPKSYKGFDLKKSLFTDFERDCVFLQISESQVGRAIRTKRYKYSVIADKDGEAFHNSDVYYEDYLYDLENDPIEKHNLVGKDEYAELREMLRALLIREMVNAGEAAPKILPAKTIKSI